MILFWCLVALMIVIALAMIIFPLKKVIKSHSILLSILLLLVPIVSVVAYLYWGNYSQVMQYVQREKYLKNPQQVINRLKQRLQQDPQNAQGWYLLGRLYVSLSRYQEASNALAKANDFKPNDAQIMLQYAQALFFLQKKRFSGKPILLIKQVLRQYPENEEALSLAALAAYLEKDYSYAIATWEKLLRRYPEQSTESNVLRRAITEAKQKVAVTY